MKTAINVCDKLVGSVSLWTELHKNAKESVYF